MDQQDQGQNAELALCLFYYHRQRIDLNQQIYRPTYKKCIKLHEVSNV